MRKIYYHPWSLLALFPRETISSSYNDLQECPKAPEPLLVGNDHSLHSANVRVKSQFEFYFIYLFFFKSMKGSLKCEGVLSGEA